MRKINLSEKALFSLIWVLIFIIYLPAARAGFVSDYTGWLDQVKNHSFAEHINRTNFGVKSFYQLTQFVTYIFYELFGISKWLWHLLFVTLHALNGFLLYLLFKRIFNDFSLKQGNLIALGGSILFCIVPHASEVVVWEPSFHYLQALLIILVILNLVRNYLETPKNRYVWISVSIFALSTFSLEFFMLIPWMVLLLGLFYYKTSAIDKARFKGLLLYVFLPMIVVFALRMLAFRIIYHDWVSRLGSATMDQPVTAYASKAVYYVYHIFFFGRFFPDEIRRKIYHALGSTESLVLFSGLVILLCLLIAVCFRKMPVKLKMASLLFIFSLLSLILILPGWFPMDNLINCDRYSYVFNAFAYMLLTLLISYIPWPGVKGALWLAFAAVNIFFTIRLNRYWKQSSDIVEHLLTDLPDPGGRTMILLNIPENFLGAPMIGANNEGEFRLMHNLLLPDKLTGKVYDGESYNMRTPGDGAHVNVTNDSLAKVTLNQWGTWWIFAGKGSVSYENEDYRINMVDEGHWYEIILKKDPKDYLLLYQVGNQWKAVDWNRKNIDQE